ncbi:MAG TPA: polysaccharide pyruvyl transferase family protein [Opitutaceae bacterium]|jgi:hypothetical protein
MKKISVITTVDHNIGDDFVRDGILHLISQVFDGMEVEMVHKHLPITARSGFAWLHEARIDRLIDRITPDLTLRVTRRLDSALPVGPSTDRIASADILVQSGGPIYWTNPEGDCAHTEWWNPLVERRWLPFAKGRPFLNLAGGTCQPYDSDGAEFAGRPDVLDHIRRFFDLTTLTTVRDQLSVEVLKRAGRTGILLPCSSLFAVDRLQIRPSAGEYVALNYMPAGGHFVLGQPINAEAWERAFSSFASELARKERVVLVCHNRKEHDAARRLLPGLEVFRSSDYRDYLRFYSKARWGILNRVHGCFALASLGKPSAVVGSDSRAKMVGQLGLPETFVNNATLDWLTGVAAELESCCTAFPGHMERLKADTARRYRDQLRAAVEPNSMKAA